MKTAFTNRVTSDEFDMGRLIGVHVNEISSLGLEFATAYPIIDPETLRVTGLVDGNYPEEFNGGNWLTGALIDGKIITGDQYCDFAIATAEENGGMN